MKRKKFTLIELIVVLSILTTLATLLTTALSQVKSKAIEMSCKNKLKQHGVTFNQFSNDHNNDFVYNLDSSGNKERYARWQYPLMSYYGITDKNEAHVFWCDADPNIIKGSKSGTQLFDEGRLSYAYNSRWISKYKTLNIEKPSDTVLLISAATDVNFSNPMYHGGYYFVVNWSNPYQPQAYPRHDGKANILWCDGSVVELESPNGTRTGFFSSSVLGFRWSNGIDEYQYKGYGGKDNKWDVGTR